jgi:class 3 adenylate cyclase
MLVGRTGECASIDSLLASVRGGAGAGLLIVGEPGIGKTALLDYASRHASDFRRLTALGLESQTAIPYAGLHELLTPILGGLSELPERQSRAVMVALGLEDHGATDSLAVYGGVLALLAEAATHEPLLLIVDDVHWLDAETVQAVAFAARRVEDESIGILMSARVNEDVELGGVPELKLDGVDTAAALALISRVRPAIAPEIARAVSNQAAGNPLALLELPTVLDHAELTGQRPLDDVVTVTAAVERAFLRRSEALTEAGRRALLLAALGDGADVDAIRRGSPQLDAGFDEAERLGLLKVREGRTEFWHPLVRSAVYSSATDGERRSAHETLAAALSERDPARSAWHLVGAGTESAEPLARRLADAGQAARRTGACASAARLFEKAASATPDKKLAAARLLSAGEAAWMAGEPQHAGSLLDRSAELSRDPELSADIAVARWWAATSGSSSPQVLFDPLVARAGELAGQHPRKAASMLAIAWDWAWTVLDIDGSRALVDRAQTLLSDGVATDDRELLTAIAWQRLADCRVREGLAAARLAIAQAHDAADLQVAFACDVLSAADEFDEALLALGDSIAELTRLGHMPTLSYSLRTRATIELRQGRLLQALKTAGEAEALADGGVASWQGWADAEIAAIEAVVGVEDRCRDHVARASESFGGDDLWSQAESQAALGLLELSLGHDDAARAALDHADQLLTPIKHPGFIRFAGDRIEVLVRLGEIQAAESALADLEGRNRLAGVSSVTHAIARGGVLLAATDTLDAAYTRALAAPTRSEFEMCRTSLVFGERLRRAGRRVDARAHLRRASEGFRTLGASRWEQRAQSELRASGARSRRSAPDQRDELTPQELQVAMVVAEGVTNREAGARLFLSPKTIEVHLSRAYLKLGVRTRTQLARRLAIEAPLALPSVQRRTLAALLFTDIVRSTERATRLGDQQWSTLLSRHNRAIESAVQRSAGHLITSTGDGVLATFDTASAALKCAVAIQHALNKLGVDVRAAVHVGEIDRLPDGNVRGIAVHIAARALGQASGGEIVVTRAVRDAARGSSFTFRSRGELPLDGLGDVELLDAEPQANTR